MIDIGLSKGKQLQRALCGDFLRIFVEDAIHSIGISTELKAHINQVISNSSLYAYKLALEFLNFFFICPRSLRQWK